MSVLTGAAPVAGPKSGEDLSAAGRTLGRPVAGGGGNNITQVTCDADELIAALVHANADGGGTLELAEECTYTLTAFDEVEHTGLPVIEQPITIKGNGATIVRGANAESFRILNVAEGGDLTLVDATIKGGDADGSGSRGGGGLLVQSGGKATVKHSTIAYNRTDTVGGGIANYGITKVLGRSHEKDGVKDGTAEDATEDDPAVDESTDGEWAEKDWGKDGVRVTDAGIHDNHADDGGGGIANYGYLAVENERLSYNTTSGDGGALANFSGAAKLVKTEIDHNAAAGQGGGVYAEAETVTKIKHSYIHDNTSNSSGGGIRNLGQLFLWDTTVRRNLAHSPGGGIFNSGELTAEKSTIDENTAGISGGGLFNFSAGTASLRGSEVTMNKAVGPNATAGGISNLVGTVALTDTRVTKNVSTAEPGGVLNNSGTVTVDDESTIIKNRPTNCEGGITEVPRCFG